uniref:Lectin/glucanase superfamily protein n=1 Tax=viral metagenome TaxID=1070528 RepID=A0A6C0AML0_9ZZZZ
MEPGSMVIYILVILVLVYLLYILWLWLNGNNNVQDMVIYSSQTDGLPARTTTTGQTFSGKQVPQIYPGGEYSMSTWIYVTNWGAGGSNGKNKPFLVLSSGGQIVTLVMYLGQFTNKLGVRVSDNVTNSIKITDIPTIVNGTSTYSDSNMQMCDIESVDIQRWVCVTVVMMGKTVDVYIDGKLSRSSVLPGLFAADGNTPTLTLGSPDGFGGLIGMTRAANVAYTPDRVYTNYQEGPFAGFTLSSLDPGQYVLSLTRNNQVVFTTGSDQGSS